MNLRLSEGSEESFPLEDFIYNGHRGWEEGGSVDYREPLLYIHELYGTSKYPPQSGSCA
jgi:hypothetical protein